MQLLVNQVILLILIWCVLNFVGLSFDDSITSGSGVTVLRVQLMIQVLLQYLLLLYCVVKKHC